MKKINVKIANPGHSMRNLMPEFWSQLQKINGATFEEKVDCFCINFSNGTILTIKNKIIKEDEHRIFYEGSLNPILNKPFWFIKMKGMSFHEMWDYYFTPGQGGFSILLEIEE
jgi:hypothetical protein